MKLKDLQGTGRIVRLICEHCGSHQPAYPNLMLEKHSPETEVDIALRLWPCMFCQQIGRFRVTISDRQPEFD